MRGPWRWSLATPPAWAPAERITTLRAPFPVKRRRSKRWPKALEAAQNAVAADGELAEAHAASAFLDAISEYRWAAALRRFDTALRFGIRPPARHPLLAW